MQMINDELEAKKKTEEVKTDPTLIENDGSDPSKMTSPEKKLFKDKLFQRCDTITEKTNFVLVNCEAVKQKVSNTISENKKVMKVYEDAQKEFNDRMEEIVEANVRSQANKYKNCKDYVEPNLKKRFEMKRERARIKAQLQHENLDIQALMSMSTTDKMYQTHTDKLDPENEYTNKSMQLTGGFNAKNNQNNAFGQVSPNVQLLVTPTPKLSEKSKLTPEDAQRVLERQLTMQLMPMYRIRQKSAGLRPLPIG